MVVDHKGHSTRVESTDDLINNIGSIISVINIEAHDFFFSKNLTGGS